jgi:hypothetical protein
MTGCINGDNTLKSMLKSADSLISDLKILHKSAAARDDYADRVVVENALKSADKLRCLIIKHTMEYNEVEDKKGKPSEIPKPSPESSNGNGKKNRGEGSEGKLKMTPTSYHIRKAERLFDSAMIEIKNGNLNAAQIDIKLAIQYDPSNKKYQDQLEHIQGMEN